jgi:hypothetical protein
VKIDGHTFHIPVMGTGFTIDTPLKVARFGIASVVPLADDHLIEEARAFHSRARGTSFAPISSRESDARARRITAYLDFLKDVIAAQMETTRRGSFDGGELVDYFEMLPPDSPLAAEYRALRETRDPAERARRQENLRGRMTAGAVDVNIMAKADRDTRPDGSPRAPGDSDALAALRGFARSGLSSSVVFSAGFNPRLYSYLAEFPDFFPDESGALKKKIILKVSDFRSAQTQGKFLAKKGIWVSEFRVESGLNCGGHAFATTGELMGPILEEFKTNRETLTGVLFDLWRKAIRSSLGRDVAAPPPVRITAQGGIGTVEEDALLRRYYRLDGTGWGSPFLLVPEATTVDSETLDRLAAATEEDIYLSRSSPMGILFNNLRGSASEKARQERVDANAPGSPCPRGTLAFNREFDGPPLCTASRAYQEKKIAELKAQNPPPEEFSRAFERIVEKSCLCLDLGDGARMAFGHRGRRPLTPAVCPGPNLAYFSQTCSLRAMVDHIYGRARLLAAPSRPHQLIKEIELYVRYLRDQVAEALPKIGEKERAYFAAFRRNLRAGMDYYQAQCATRFEGWLSEAAEFNRKLSELRAGLEDFAARHQPVFA